MRRLPSFLAAVALAVLASGTALAQKTQLLVYTALETDQLKAYEEGFYKAVNGRRVEVGTRFDRRDHRQAAGREGQSAGRRRLGPGRDEPRAVRDRGDAAALRARGTRRDPAAIPGQQEPALLVGHGRLGRHRLLQHGRGREDEPAQAGNVAGPDQAGLQGQDRHAQSGLVRHRLPRRDGVAADLRRAGRLEVHGRAAREHRAIHALRQQALRAGGQRRISRSAFRSNIAPTRSRPRAGRSTSSSRRKAWAGTSRRSAS